jgi:hypothetical protein
MIHGNKEELKKPTAAGIVKTLTSDELSMMRDMHARTGRKSLVGANEVEARTFTNDEILDALDGLSDKKAGMGRLMLYIVFVAVFYMVLILQKAPEDVFEVQDVVQESINGLEWSHGNSWQVRIGSTRFPRAHERLSFSCSSLSPPTHTHMLLFRPFAVFVVCTPPPPGQSSTKAGTGDPLRPHSYLTPSLSPPPYPASAPGTGQPGRDPVAQLCRQRLGVCDHVCRADLPRRRPEPRGGHQGTRQERHRGEYGEAAQCA